MVVCAPEDRITTIRPHRLVAVVACARESGVGCLQRRYQFFIMILIAIQNTTLTYQLTTHPTSIILNSFKIQ